MFYHHYSDYHQSLLEEVGPRHVSHLLSKLLNTASRILTQVNTHIHTAYLYILAIISVTKDVALKNVFHQTIDH